MRSSFWSVSQIVIFAVMILGFSGLTRAQASEAPGQSAQRCVACHKDASEKLAMGKHGVKADMRTLAASDQSCFACHTDAAAHGRSPRDAASMPKLFTKTADAVDSSQACLACHSNSSATHPWTGSKHERSDVACTDCHTIHTAKDPVMVPQTQAGVCYDCHKDIRAASMRTSKHPMTGSMTCTSCHQPHGSVGEFSLIKATINETCDTCHADKRGPYLWPHTPVQESCSNCHNPHGTNTRPMLESRFLCQQCHTQTHRNDGMVSSVGQSCANCHMKVHGSNHPNGSALTR